LAISPSFSVPSPSSLFRNFREGIVNTASLGGYVAIPIVLLHFRDARAHQFILPAIAVLAFVAWMLSLKRLLAIGGTPTSKIASAAQGYVELIGRARAHPGGALRSRYTLLPCVWFHYVVEQRERDGKWHQIESARSDDSFLLDDGSGFCLVDPQNAEVLPRSTEVTKNGNDWRCTESLILPGDQVYAIGEFTTIGGEDADLNLERDVGELLATWKRDKPALLARFDLDKDGQIGEKEWLLARAQARREVRKTHLEIRTQPGTHMLHQPRDGRLFLISNVDAAKLERRYKIWAWLHLVVLIAAVVGEAWFTV
jgi:hypothetical protein